MRALWWMVAAFAFLFDPMSACYDDDAHYSYDDVDMRIAIEGTWRLTTPHGLTSTIVIREASEPVHAARERSFVRTAAACGDRSFVRTAGACMNTTTMKLDVRMVGSDPHGKGELVILNSYFDEAQLELDVAGLGLEAKVSPIGQATAEGATFVRISASLQ